MNYRMDTTQNLHLIPQTQYYKRSQQPLLSQQKTISIQQKLQLQKQAILYSKQRQANLDYYVKYNYNPFIKYKGQDGIYIQSMMRNNKSQVINIVDKLADMSQANKQRSYSPFSKQRAHIQPRMEIQSDYLKNMKDNFQLFSDKILNNIQKQKNNGNLALLQLNKPRSPGKRIKKTLTLIPEPRAQQLQTEQQIVARNPNQQQLSKYDIQNIAATKEQNFFIKNYKRVNIFKIARGDDEEISSRQLLGKYNFCLNAMVQKMNKIKFPIYREMSTMARKVILGQSTSNQNIIDYVDSYEHSFKLKQLLFHDIMSVASNRFSADYLNKVLNFDEGAVKETSDASSQQKYDNPITYKKNQQNRQNNFINKNEEIQQIKDYKNLKNNEIELKHQKNYKKQQVYIDQKLELRRDLTGLTVEDNYLHGKIQKDVNLMMQKFLRMDDSKTDPAWLVRYNKKAKNKSQVSKIKTLLETLANKNKQDQLLDIRKGSKSKSKSKRK